MENFSPTRTARMPHTSGGLARLAYARLVAARIPALPLLREAGLTLDLMRHESARLKVRDQIRFLNLASDALNDDILGFDLAIEADFRKMGLLYYVMSSSENLKEALERASRYSVIVNEGVVQDFRRGKGDGITIRYVDVSRHPDQHQIEFWMAGIVLVCRQLSGRRITPRCVRFVHSRKSHHVRFREIFGDNLKFGATVDEVVFSENLEMIPVISADQYLNTLLVKYCEEALAGRPAKSQSFQASVENAIVPLLPHGKAVADEIAQQLGVSRRTLARRLAEEGLSFSKLLEDLKLHLAMRYLADEELSVSEIAWLLGYQEIGAFSRAFKSWTGKTPRETRSAIAPGRRVEPVQGPISSF